MGYTGSIRLNGNTLLSERKSNDTCYGKEYATKYLRQVGVDLTEKTIRSLYTQLFLSSKRLNQFYYTEEFIFILEALISNKFKFDEDGFFEGKVLRDGNQYKFDGAGFSFYEFQIKKAFRDDDRGKEHLDYLLNNPISMEYLASMTAELLEIQESERDNLTKNRLKMIEYLQIFNEYLEDVKQGYVVRVRFSPLKENVLEIFSSKSNVIKELDVESERDFYNLFSELSLYTLGACCTITTKTELGRLIQSFYKVKNRNNRIEQTLIDYYNSISITDTFHLEIEGSY